MSGLCLKAMTFKLKQNRDVSLLLYYNTYTMFKHSKT